MGQYEGGGIKNGQLLLMSFLYGMTAALPNGATAKNSFHIKKLNSKETYTRLTIALIFETVLLLKLSDKMLNKRDFLKIDNLYAWSTINICMFTRILIIEA